MRLLLTIINKRLKIYHVVLLWFIVNLASAIFTPLYSDEAYYTLFAKNLDFGYFDHPPMIALMIRIGLILFRNEFGVRLISVAAITLALYLIYKIADVNKPFLFLASVFSVFGLNVLGFLALPDSPLLLSAVLFFVVYKRFLIKESYLNSLLLGLTIAAMLYSKYHGILIILFTLISNLKLLRSGKFYLSAFIAFLLLIPHIVWQYNNDFVSITYHLFERSASDYKTSFTSDYLLGQVLYYGPFSAIFMIIAALTFRKPDLFEKALSCNLWGFLGFFLLCTLKGRVEVNWTFPIIIPLLIFFLKSSFKKPLFEKWYYILAFPVIIITTILRLQVIYPIMNLSISRIGDFRGHREMADEIVNNSSGLPVITNNYQRAGLISFYTNTFVPSINTNSRRNQFNLWHSEYSLRFRKVAYVNNYMDEGIKIRDPYYNDYRVTIIDSLPVMNDIVINADLPGSLVKPGGRVEVRAVLAATNVPDDYHDTHNFHTRLHAALYAGNILVDEKVCEIPIDILLKKNAGEYSFQFIAPVQRGRYRIQISLNTSALGIWSTKKTLHLVVK